jgi:hypothetical protein
VSDRRPVLSKSRTSKLDGLEAELRKVIRETSARLESAEVRESIALWRSAGFSADECARHLRLPLRRVIDEFDQLNAAAAAEENERDESQR